MCGQSEHRIHFTLPPCRFSHIIKTTCSNDIIELPLKNMVLQYSIVHFSISSNLGSKGWRSGESTHLRDGAVVRVLASHQCGPGSNPGVGAILVWVEFVVGSLLCSKRFSFGYSGFPLSSKTNISKFQFDQESGRRRTTLWMCYLQFIIIIITIIIIYLKGCPLSKQER